MNILFVSYFFPPFNTIGAVRVGKFAKFLVKQNHDIRVVSARKQPLPDNLPLEINTKIVSYSPWIDVNGPRNFFLGKKKAGINTILDGNRKKLKHRIISKAKEFYNSMFHFPDPQIGWYPYALSGGRKLLQDWKPDIIFASAMPYTSLLVANRLSKEFQIPWVAEFRDLWVDNHYREYGPLRNFIDTKIEKSTLQSASGLVTVSEPAAEILRSKYTQPCVVIPNGFDPDDYDSNAKPSDEASLKIVYTGSLYRGKRDPSNLFKAIDLLGKDRGNVDVHFYGPNLGLVGDLAKKYGCEANVQVHDPIPYLESLRVQQQADILLLLLWDNPEEKGVFTGKVFEYLGARRPILIIGPEDNVASQTIIERRAGIVATDPEAIAGHLKIWIENKKKGIPIESPPEEATKGFTREEQARKLAEFLESIVLESRDKQ
ncbi:MAG TPA: glycosyltransferase family 4 protein [Synergistales bacterium]|nr:glycosyltransferase family 4 protein [Synergistales bacterium]